MKSQLPALMRPISSTRHAGQPLVSRQPLRGGASHNADYENDAAKAPQDPYSDGDSNSRLDLSANADRSVYHGTILVRTKKKRFG